MLKELPILLIWTKISINDKINKINNNKYPTNRNLRFKNHEKHRSKRFLSENIESGYQKFSRLMLLRRRAKNFEKNLVSRTPSKFEKSARRSNASKIM